jgi:hypothetical protein
MSYEGEKNGGKNLAVQFLFTTFAEQTKIKQDKWQRRQK